MMNEETVLAQWDEYKRVCTIENKKFIDSIGGLKAVRELTARSKNNRGKGDPHAGTANDILDLFGSKRVVHRDTMRDRFVVKFGWDDRKNCSKRFHSYVRRMIDNGTLSLDVQLGGGHKSRLVRTRMPYQRPWA